MNGNFFCFVLGWVGILKAGSSIRELDHVSYFLKNKNKNEAVGPVMTAVCDLEYCVFGTYVAFMVTHT